MFNEFKGMSFSGSFFGGKTLLNIPGIKTLIMPSKGVKTNNLSRISKVVDQSGLGADFVMDFIAKQPLLITDGNGFKAIRIENNKTSSNVSLDNILPESYWRFLHNGSPYGVFVMVQAFGNGLDTVNEVMATVSQGASQNGYALRLLDSAAGTFQNTIQKQVRNVKLTSTAPNGSIPQGRVNLIQDISHGYLQDGNDNDLYINQTLVVSTNYIAAPVTTASERTLRIATPNSPAERGTFDLYLLAVYDWTGYTLAQQNDFRSQVVELIYRDYNFL